MWSTISEVTVITIIYDWLCCHTENMYQNQYNWIKCDHKCGLVANFLVMVTLKSLRDKHPKIQNEIYCCQLCKYFEKSWKTVQNMKYTTTFLTIDWIVILKQILLQVIEVHEKFRFMDHHSGTTTAPPSVSLLAAALVGTHARKRGHISSMTHNSSLLWLRGVKRGSLISHISR